MGHETSYYSEPDNKIEKERRLKILSEGVEQLNTAGIEAVGKLLKGDAVDKIVEYAHTIVAACWCVGFVCPHSNVPLFSSVVDF